MASGDGTRDLSSMDSKDLFSMDMKDLKALAGEVGVDHKKKSKSNLVTLLSDTLLSGIGDTSAPRGGSAGASSTSEGDGSGSVSRGDSLPAIVTAITTLVHSIADLTKQLNSIHEHHFTQVADLQKEITALREEVVELRKDRHTDGLTAAQRPHVEPGSVEYPTLNSQTQGTNHPAEYPTHHNRPSPMYSLAAQSVPADATNFGGRNGLGVPSHTAEPDNDIELDEGFQAVHGQRSRQVKGSLRQHVREDHNVHRQHQSTRRAETSRYLASKAPRSNKSERSSLTGRPRVKVLYVGNIDPEYDADSIATHCKENGVDIVQAVVYSSPHYHTAYARVTCTQEHADELEKESFWPDTIGFTVRPWRFASEGRPSSSA